MPERLTYKELEQKNKELEKEISKYKLSEEKLKREHNIFLGGPAVIFQWAAKENWPAEYVSPNVAQFGLKAEDFMSGRIHFIDVIHPEDREKIVLEVQRHGESGVPFYEQEYRIIQTDGEIRWVYDFTVVGRNEKKEITHYDGYILDITERKQAKDALHKANERLEEKIKAGTAELVEKNTALKVLLDQRGDDRKKFEDTITSSVKELLIPSLTRLKNNGLNSKQRTELNILESNLNKIISPFATNLLLSNLQLTPTEMQVANFIKHGASSKDIADHLSLSRRTVDTHRYNIRKKIGIRRKGVNLGTYLSSLT